MPSVLHAGCGGDPLPAWLDGYQETRLDIDPKHAPHIVASMTDLGDIGPFDMVYSSHSLEHLWPHEVPQALGEFRRVLKPGGGVVVIVPDLEDVQATDDVLFMSPAGPISGLDLIYGFRPMLKENPFMAHRTGFTADTLRRALEGAGFERVEVKRLECHGLMAGAA